MSEYIVKCKEFTSCIGNKLQFPDYIDYSQEIVRCRDCKHFTYADSEHDNNDWCAKHEHIAWSVNGYCAWGERRDA